ncbi:hypothetical protein ACPTGO_30690, partial [Pseudomonas aeruginosa]
DLPYRREHWGSGVPDTPPAEKKAPKPKPQVPVDAGGRQVQVVNKNKKPKPTENQKNTQKAELAQQDADVYMDDELHNPTIQHNCPSAPLVRV